MSDIIELSCKIYTKGWFWLPITRTNKGGFSNALLKFNNTELDLFSIDNSGDYSLLDKIHVMEIKRALVKKNAVTTMKHFVKPIYGGLVTAIAINILVFLSADEIVIGPLEIFLCFLGLCAGGIALNTVIFFFSVPISPLSKIVLETETDQSFLFFVEQDCFKNVVKIMEEKGICVEKYLDRTNRIRI